MGRTCNLHGKTKVYTYSLGFFMRKLLDVGHCSDRNMIFQRLTFSVSSNKLDLKHL